MNNEEMMDSGLGSLTVPVMERGVSAEANAEYTLPDYLPEIRKLLHIEQTVLPPAKYVNSNSAQMNGTVECRILYVGADGNLYTAPISADYSVNLPIDPPESADASSGFDVICSARADGVVARVTGPRRISIRGRVWCCVRVFGSAHLYEKVLGEVDPDSVYKRRERCMTAAWSVGSSDIVDVEYDISPLADTIRMVDADASVMVDEISSLGNTLNCRGEVILRALAADEASGENINIVKKLPFESEIDMDEALKQTTGTAVKVRGVPTEVRVDIEDGAARCRVGIILEATCLENSSAEYTADIYSSDCECESNMENIDSVTVLLCKNGNFTLSERISSEDAGIAATAEIVTAFGNAVIDSCKREDNKYVFDGNARFSVISRDNGEYSCSDINIPFKYESEGMLEGEISSFSASSEVFSMRASNEGGNFSIDAEIALCLDCLGSNKISAVREVKFSDPIENDSTALVVCYPSHSDTLWSVAKRYKVSPEKIIGNPQTDKYLIIG